MAACTADALTITMYKSEATTSFDLVFDVQGRLKSNSFLNSYRICCSVFTGKCTNSGTHTFDLPIGHSALHALASVGCGVHQHRAFRIPDCRVCPCAQKLAVVVAQWGEHSSRQLACRWGGASGEGIKEALEVRWHRRITRVCSRRRRPVWVQAAALVHPPTHPKLLVARPTRYHCHQPAGKFQARYMSYICCSVAVKQNHPHLVIGPLPRN